MKNRIRKNSRRPNWLSIQCDALMAGSRGMLNCRPPPTYPPLIFSGDFRLFRAGIAEGAVKSLFDFD
jgi:hypothetical protein